MRNKLKYILWIPLCLLVLNSSAQSKTDSLKQVVDTISDPKLKVKTITALIPRLGYVGEEARTYIDMGLKIAESTTPYSYNKMIYINAVSYYREGEIDKADSILNHCLEFFKIDHWTYNYLGSRGLKATLLRKNKAYFKSLNLALNTIAEAEAVLPDYQTEGEFDKTDILSTMSALYNDVGNLYQEIGDLDMAAKYSKKSAETDRSLGDERGYGISLSNLGSILDESGKHEEAKKILEEAYEIKKKINRKVSTAFTELNLAENAILRKDFNLAQEYINKCKPVFEGVDYPEGIATVIFNEGEIQKGLNNCTKAISRYEEALAIIDKIEVGENREKILLGIYNCYKALGNTAKALTAHEDYFSEMEKRKGEELTKQISLKQAGWEYDSQLALVKLENEKSEAIAQSQITRLANLRNMLILGLLGLAAILYLLYRAFKSKTRFNTQLKEKNQLIAKNLSEKELLLKEIHHRVKNNLQVISSLLSLQSNYIEDDSALSAIQEGRDRVKSMAIIHQDLYQEDNLTGIEVKSYFEKLTRSLFNSYNIRPEQIKLILDIEAINLDVDTVIPIGLIVNELITNALKYAFPNDRKGTITIDLKEINNELILKVIDDGIGFDADQINNESKSFGYKIIQAFQEKLDAELKIDGADGTNVLFTMSEYKNVG